MRIVTGIGETVARSGALSRRTLEELRQTLHVAGFRGEHGLGLFVGTKLLLVLGLPLLAIVARPGRRIRRAASERGRGHRGGIGLLAPDKIVQHLRARTCERWKRACRTRLDMMVICGQAGLRPGGQHRARRHRNRATRIRRWPRN